MLSISVAFSMAPVDAAVLAGMGVLSLGAAIGRYLRARIGWWVAVGAIGAIS